MEIFEDKHGSELDYFKSGQKVMSIEFANRKIRELLGIPEGAKVLDGFTVDEYGYNGGDENYNIVVNKGIKNDLKFVVYALPLPEEEKPECDHYAVSDHRDWGRVFNWKFCPKCGEELS